MSHIRTSSKVLEQMLHEHSNGLILLEQMLHTLKRLHIFGTHVRHTFRTVAVSHNYSAPASFGPVEHDLVLLALAVLLPAIPQEQGYLE